ncbi:hypothetical protein HO173_008953 [Letharia columbiana]|uniref:Uncharacterized protein n=1 Tax=Letharia columbiana TaxID=112416 RepID=A0A8H6FQB1_9LECA|nr:uncharacterized protein HO173_008953 [Letharia columbiana]KAF6232739.1 hypothetical protein HO173_008953 [Letharia columbiana]
MIDYQDDTLGAKPIVICHWLLFLTHHAFYDPDIHSTVLLEASEIADELSGKARGLLAKWAAPECLAPSSFTAHAELAEKHGGGKRWGYRNINCAEIELQAQDLDATEGNYSCRKGCFFSTFHKALTMHLQNWAGCSLGVSGLTQR